MIIISDSTPLILLSKVDHLDILHLLFDYVIIPQSVYNEVFVAVSGKSDKHKVLMPYWIKVEAVQDHEAVVILRKRFGRLSQADAEVIVLAEEKQADFVLSDDKELHRVAQFILTNTEVLYTSAVLIFAKQEGIIDSIKDLLDEMRRKGAWIDNEIYNLILVKAGET